MPDHTASLVYNFVKYSFTYEIILCCSNQVFNEVDLITFNPI